MHEEQRMLTLIGDPILDTYIYYGEPDSKGRLPAIKTIDKPGGAYNVDQNIRKLLSKKVFFNSLTRNGYSDSYINLIRHHKVDGSLWFESINNINTKDISKTYVPPNHIFPNTWRNAYTGLVISDYNKGSVNCNPKLKDNPFFRDKGLTKFSFVLIDSRYGTVWEGYPDMGECAILHATGSELSLHNHKLYKYMLHTNGKSPVTIYKDGLPLIELDVPDTQVVDTVGAGDTFTASVACELILHSVITDDIVIAATTKSIERCQAVIQKHGTAVP